MCRIWIQKWATFSAEFLIKKDIFVDDCTLIKINKLQGKEYEIIFDTKFFSFKIDSSEVLEKENFNKESLKYLNKSTIILVVKEHKSNMMYSVLDLNCKELLKAIVYFSILQ